SSTIWRSALDDTCAPIPLLSTLEEWRRGHEQYTDGVRRSTSRTLSVHVELSWSPPGPYNDLAFSSEAGAPSRVPIVLRSGRGGQRSCPSARHLAAERTTEPGFVCCNALLD